MKNDELLTRGVEQVLPSSDGLAKLMDSKKIRLFLGIDPTGSQLHLGHSVVLRKLNQFANAGHDVILLIGNGTVKIGDPTGRDSTRPVLTDEQIKDNFITWKEQASTILDFTKIKIVYNGDWLDKLTYVDIIKLMAQTTVQQLIERDMFQKRIEDKLPIFGHEIMYPLIQGYDSVAMNVDLELGGTDQTFNMMMGRHLQRVYNNHEKWVLTTPIINGTDGRKMSKSYNNYVGLTEAPNDMYGKLMSITDHMIIEYFTLLTDTPMAEINEMDSAMKGGTNPMEFKKKLALTITEMYHDTQKAQEAQEYFEKTVQNKEIPSELPNLPIPAGFTLNSLPAITAVRATELVNSNNEARNLFSGKGVTLNGVPILNANITLGELGAKKGDTFRVGKRGYFRITDEKPEVIEELASMLDNLVTE